MSYCDEQSCRRVVSGLKFPNGLAKGLDGLIYVPSSLIGMIEIYRPQPNGDLVRVDSLDAGYSLDNLSVDRDGDIYGAAITDSVKFFGAHLDPYNKDAPTAALKVVKKADGEYVITKAIEDGKGEVLPAATTILHDATTGRIFASGKYRHDFAHAIWFFH